MLVIGTERIDLESGKINSSSTKLCFRAFDDVSCQKPECYVVLLLELVEKLGYSRKDLHCAFARPIFCLQPGSVRCEKFFHRSADLLVSLSFKAHCLANNLPVCFSIVAGLAAS